MIQSQQNYHNGNRLGPDAKTVSLGEDSSSLIELWFSFEHFNGVLNSYLYYLPPKSSPPMCGEPYVLPMYLLLEFAFYVPTMYLPSPNPCISDFSF